MSQSNDIFNLLRKIKQNPNQAQRKLASQLGFSLGKLNYCMQALKDKGLIKIKNFKNNKSKLNYIYVITPKGDRKNKTHNKIYESKNERV